MDQQQLHLIFRRMFMLSYEDAVAELNELLKKPEDITIGHL